MEPSTAENGKRLLEEQDTVLKGILLRKSMEKTRLTGVGGIGKNGLWCQERIMLNDEVKE